MTSLADAWEEGLGQACTEKSSLVKGFLTSFEEKRKRECIEERKYNTIAIPRRRGKTQVGRSDGRPMYGREDQERRHQLA